MLLLLKKKKKKKGEEEEEEEEKMDANDDHLPEQQWGRVKLKRASGDRLG